MNGLPLLRQLLMMMADGRWRHPGDEALHKLIPYLVDPVNFLRIESMRLESVFQLADDPKYSALFRIARSKCTVASELPWLDAHKAVFIAVCRFAGDDVAIALDYRTRSDDPRVAANEWLPEMGGCLWREVAGTLSEFARQLFPNDTN